MMYQLTLIVLMVLSSFGMIKAYLAHKTGGAVWGRPVSGLFGVLAVSLAVMHLVYVFRHDDIRFQTAVDAGAIQETNTPGVNKIYKPTVTSLGG